MSTIPAKWFVDELLIALEETFEKVYGMYLDKHTSIFETLAEVDANMASQPMGASCATIAAHVEHMSFYLETLQKFAAGEIAPGTEVDWKHIWNTVSAVTPEEWEASKAKLRERYQTVRAFVQSQTEWHNADMVGGAIGIVAHNAYHLGEIRQALCRLRK